MKKKKSSSLLNMIEKERHRVAASITREQEWEQPEPNSGLARMFVIMLLIHVFVIGGIIIYDFIGDSSHSSQASASASSTKEQSSSTAANVSAAPLPMVSSASAPKPEPATVETPKAADVPAPGPQQPSPLSSMPKALAYTPPTEEKPAEEARTSTPIVTAKANTSDPIAFHHQDEESDTAATHASVTSRAGSSGLEKEESKAPEEKKVQAEKPKTASSSTESTRSKTDKPASKVADKPSSSQPKPVAPPSVMRKALAGDGKPPAATATKKKDKDESDPPSTKKAAKPASNSPTKHTIVKGDTVYSMARRFKVSEAALMKANGIKNANALTLGKVITIPASK